HEEKGRVESQYGTASPGGAQLLDGLDGLLPILAFSFGGKRLRKIAIVAENVRANGWIDGRRLALCQCAGEFGVCLVGKPGLAGMSGIAGIEIAIRNRKCAGAGGLE